MKLAQTFLKLLKRRLDRVNDISSMASIHPEAWVSGSTISDGVSIAQKCKVYCADISGSVAIDRYTSIWGPGIHIVGPIHGIRVGAFTSIAHHVSMHESFHNIQRTSTYYIERNLFGVDLPLGEEISRGPIIIGNDVWIGAGATILSGVQIGDGSVIGAGAVVTRAIPPYVVAAGNPATIVRDRFAPEDTRLLQASQWWTWSEDRLRDEADFLTRLHSRD
jgi:virginiamycin A acetyltransferase